MPAASRVRRACSDSSSSRTDIASVMSLSVSQNVIHRVRSQILDKARSLASSIERKARRPWVLLDDGDDPIHVNG